MSLRVVLIIGFTALAVAFGYLSYEILVPAPPPPPPMAGQPAPPPQPRQQVVVATAAMQVGTLLKETDLRSQELGENQPGKDLIRATPEAMLALRGAILRRALAPGEPLHANDVLRSRDRGFLAAVLAPGTRAVTVGVDPVTGVSGLVWPGDRVDLILTLELADATLPPGLHFTGETILQDIRVVAVDQQVLQGSTGPADGRVVRTVALEVTAPQAERVAVALRLGRLTLTVRPGEAAAVEPTPQGPIFGADVSSALTRPAPPALRMQVFHGDTHEEFSFR